jgi:predicted lactoylglutathione lyase
MIGYITLGTNDMQRAGAFYDALLAELGASRTMDMQTFIAWGTSAEGVALAVIKPYDGNPASIGNGVMVGLAADSRETVERVYNKAMALGAKDEGPAGPRGDTFYAGYFRDPDGNKLNIFYSGE